MYCGHLKKGVHIEIGTYVFTCDTSNHVVYHSHNLYTMQRNTEVTTQCARQKTWRDDLPSSSGAGNGSGGGVRVTETQNKHNCQHATK